MATAGPASSHSSVQLGAGEELNGDKVFALQEGFVHMKVDDICKECRLFELISTRSDPSPV